MSWKEVIIINLVDIRSRREQNYKINTSKFDNLD